MPALINHSNQTNHIPSILSTVAIVLLVGAVLPSAHAELITHSSKDDLGRTKMVVYDAHQKELPPAQLGITPSRINETVSLSNNKNKQGLNQSLTLYNYGNKPKIISLDIIDLDTSGTPISPSERTLKTWTLINPTLFTIPAGGYQTVRMAIRLPINFEKGQYKAMLSIEQQVENAISYDADGQGVTLEIGSRYGMPINIEIQ